MVRSSEAYLFRYEEGFEWLVPTREADFGRLRFAGQSLRASWKPVEMKRIRFQDGRELARSDFPAFSGGDMLILSGLAKTVIGGYLEPYAELLPLECADGEYWAVNVTRLIDVLDESNSDFLRAPDTGAILLIHRHTFREIPTEGVFKLSQTPHGLIYATPSFVNLVSGSMLAGLEFTLAS